MEQDSSRGVLQEAAQSSQPLRHEVTWDHMSIPPISESVLEPAESPAIVSDTPDADLGKAGAKGRFSGRYWSSSSPFSAPASGAGRKVTRP